MDGKIMRDIGVRLERKQCSPAVPGYMSTSRYLSFTSPSRSLFGDGDETT